MIKEKILTLLKENRIQFTLTHHAPATTSADSARERGESIKIGAKALMLKTDKGYFLAVLPADRRLDSSAYRKLVKARKIRFATKNELIQLTGLVPGAVPPFGEIISIPMLVDKALFEEEYMAFNAGTLTDSVKMKTADFNRIVSPNTGSFSKQNT
tara:strand:- start:43696 stop:44163 length:468 start_codon:yes stop_codon:yes gene_type:complete